MADLMPMESDDAFMASGNICDIRPANDEASHDTKGFTERQIQQLHWQLRDVLLLRYCVLLASLTSLEII